MISGIIVYGSLLLAGAFVLVYACSPALRRKIEQPKYSFQKQLTQYDRPDAGNKNIHRGHDNEA